MRQWTESFDMSTVPDAVLQSEMSRRNSLRRRTYGAGTGRPKVMRKCPVCRRQMGTVELRRHSCDQ